MPKLLLIQLAGLMSLSAIYMKSSMVKIKFKQVQAFEKNNTTPPQLNGKAF